MACCPKCPSWWCHSSLVTAWGGLSRLLAALHARDAPLRRPGPSGEEAVRRGREGRPKVLISTAFVPAGTIPTARSRT